MSSWRALFLAIVPMLAACGGGGGALPAVVPTQSSFPVNTSGTPMNLQSNLESMGAWLTGYQLTADGAILYSPTMIHPYFANIAAIALTKDASKIVYAQKWMAWYLAHSNATDKWGLHNTIYDFSVNGTVVTPTMDADSTDSYAATFLTLARAVFENGDGAAQSYVRSVAPQLYAIADMLLSIQASDGLTFAKPGDPTRYLMDNSEVYRGLSDITFLAQTFGEVSAQLRFGSAANRVSLGIEALWNPASRTYAPWKTDNGVATARLSVWYPDATAQLFPVLYGVARPTDPRSQMLYTRFNQSFPNWTELNIPDEFPWAAISDVAAIMGDAARAKAYFSAVQAKYGPAYGWPWECAEAGWYIRANNAVLLGPFSIAQN